MKLQIKDLTIKYKDRIVIENFSHTFNSGQISLLFGQSGSGKTSLLNAINGVIPHYQKAMVEGDIQIDEVSILGKNVYDRADTIGTIFQNPRDQIVFSRVDDELVFPLENKKMDPILMKNKLPKMLENIRLNSKDKTWTLSGGQKQTLISEAILAMDQEIILLDEPLASLDVDAAKTFMERLKKIAVTENKMIIIAEHRKTLVEEYVDEIIDFSKDASYSKQVDNLSLDYDEEDQRPSVYSARDLSLKFNDKLVLDRLNFDIEYGDRVLIEGDNGSGKTSLLNILVGIYKKSEGQIHSDYKIENIRRGIKFKSQVKLKAGLVLQNPDYQLFMPSVEKEISLNAPDEKFIELLVDQFEIHDLLDRNPLSLSEGQKRIIGFIAILATKPDILILDEPSVGIDEGKLNLMLEAIKKYEDILEKEYKRLTLIIVSHDERLDKSIFTKKIKL